MRLVSLKDLSNRSIYVNPDKVQQLVPADAGNPKQSRTQIVFGHEESVYVFGDCEAIARELLDL